MEKIILYGFYYVSIEGIPRFMTKFITHISVIEDTYDYIHYNHYEQIEKDT